jgi:hypothetical protein|tara:strand:- start:292 stop:429 length:138 start_codon:yes stop_codon:yes gene_type:complete
MNRRKFLTTSILISIFPTFFIKFADKESQKLKIINGWVLKAQDLD